MQLLDEQSAADYLRQAGRVDPAERLVVRELAGGVSNMVLLVERPDRPGGTLVLKQGREQLRTQSPWFADLKRIWREADVLRACQELMAHLQADPALPLVATPRILFEDHDQFLFAMTPAASPHVTWKTELLAAPPDLRVAAACGRLLGTLHGHSWNNNDLRRRFGDRSLFDALRVDPYYRTLASARPDSRPAVDYLIASLEANSCALVHADFSPKNLLHSAGALMLVDFETGHFGDPAFDLGFFLSHLVLKAALHAPRHESFLQATNTFKQSYDQVLRERISAQDLTNLWSRGVQNFAGCVWARLDGKSPVEYLSEEARREAIRQIARTTFASHGYTWDAVLGVVRDAFRSLPPPSPD